VCRLCLKAFDVPPGEEINAAAATVTDFPSALKVANAKAAGIIADLSTALHVLHRYDDTRLNEALAELVQAGSTQSEVARAMGWSRQRLAQRLKKS
jgi:fumarate hydratase class II